MGQFGKLASWNCYPRSASLGSGLCRGGPACPGSQGWIWSCGTGDDRQSPAGPVLQVDGGRWDTIPLKPQFPYL